MKLSFCLKLRKVQKIRKKEGNPGIYFVKQENGNKMMRKRAFLKKLRNICELFNLFFNNKSKVINI